MDERRLLLAMAERLYQDIKFVTEQSPVQIVDEDGAKAYNNLLTRVKASFSSVSILSDLDNWAPRNIKYKDALISAGQLHAILKTILEPTGKATAPAPAPPQAPSQPPPIPLSPISDPTAAPSTRGAGFRPAPAAPPPRRPGSSDTGLRQHTFSPVSEPTPSPSERISRPTQVTPLPERESFDPDLYGSSVPSKRNEDGTIPFTLD